MLKDAFRGLSIAGLCLMTSWIELHFLSPESAYYLPVVPGRVDHTAAVFLTLLLAGLFLAAIRTARRAPPRLRAVLCLSAIVPLALIPLNALRIYVLPLRLGALPSRHRAVAAGLLLLVLVAALLLVLRWWSQALRIAAAISLAMAPFALWMCVRSGVSATTGAGLGRAGATESAGRLAQPTSPGRVVWLIFDELDYGVAFARRPKGLALPELDRLRRESLFATHADPAGRHTIVAITSLIVGERLLTVTPETEADFSAIPAGGGEISSGETTSLFRRVRAHNHDTWVVGWALPYCRTWGTDLSGCVWEPAFTSVLGRSRTLVGSMLDQAHALSPFNRRRLAVEAYAKVVGAAEQRLRSRDAGLILVHLPVPHPPPIYDRVRGRLTTRSTSAVQGYLGNLALADRTLGRLRRVMEDSGTWAQTTVLATADHPWRDARLLDGTADARVPFVLKLAGQEAGVEYGGELDTARTGALLLAILDERLKAPNDVIGWLERNRVAPAGAQKP